MASNRRPNCCINCGETVSTIVSNEKGSIIWEIPVDTYNNNDGPAEDHPREKIRVQNILSSIYKLNYLDELKSLVDKNKLLVPTQVDNCEQVEEEEAGVCQPCCEVLCNLFRFYDQFQQLRKIDSHLSNKILELDDLINRLPTIVNCLNNNITSIKSEPEEQGQDEKEDDDDVDLMDDPDDVSKLMECEFQERDDPLLFPSASSSSPIQEKKTKRGNKKLKLSKPRVHITRLEENQITRTRTIAPSRTRNNRNSKAKVSYEIESPSEAEEDADIDADESADFDFVIKEEDVDSESNNSADDDDSEEVEIEESSHSSHTPRASSSKRNKSEEVKTKSKRRRWNKRPPKILLNGTCPICNESFQVASNLTNHLLTHMPDKSVNTCPVPGCSRTVKLRQALVAHIKTYHTLDRLPQCPICQKQFSHRYDRKIHMKVHEKQNIHICLKCDDQFETKALLETHLSSRHPTVERQCSSCPQLSFETNYKLDAHMKEVHPGEKLLPCGFCSLFFCSVTDVLRHRARRHQKVYKCPGGCGRLFTSEAKLKAHEDSNTCDGQQIYVCSYCAKSFKGKNLFNIHEKIHTGEATRYKCTHPGCDKFFYHVTGLNYHLQTHSEVKAFTCDQCGMSFTTAKAMRSHMTTHFQQKRHLCQVCGKSFLRLTGLTKHSRVHSDVRAHQCEFCLKDFKYPDSLRLHVRTYHQETPAFTCEFCEAGFPYKFILQKHLATAHGQ